MPIEKPNDSTKFKPRGKPFGKNNFKGKAREPFLGSSRGSMDDKGGTIAPLPKKEVMESINEPVKEIKEPNETLPDNLIEIIDTMEFTKGQNLLAIKLLKKGNRAYRVQIFLNDKQEIRPTTHNGSSTALSFWNLLKGTLKND